LDDFGLRSLRIAFLASNKDPARFQYDASYRYRSENLALMLREQGHDVSLCHYRDFKPKNAQFDIIVFHRPSDNWHFRRALARCKKTGAQLIADVDDLIIHPKWASFSPGVLNNLLPAKKIEAQFKMNFVALSHFDKLTTSTTALAQRLLETFSADVQVIPNAPHQTWKHSSTHTTKIEKPSLTYFPGTASHDRDFARIVEPLNDFLSDHPHVTLNITGIMNAPIGIKSKQLKLKDKQPFDVYATEVSKSWINLSPLESTPFNECKSALKTIEAAFWGRPTISSPNSDNLRYEGCGAFIAKDNNDWFNQLSSLINPDIYQKEVFNISKRAQALSLPKKITGDFLTFGGIK